MPVTSDVLSEQASHIHGGSQWHTYFRSACHGNHHCKEPHGHHRHFLIFFILVYPSCRRRLCHSTCGSTYSATNASCKGPVLSWLVCLWTETPALGSEHTGGRMVWSRACAHKTIRVTAAFRVRWPSNGKSDVCLS